MKIHPAIVFLVVSTACSNASSTEPTDNSPTAIPAGEVDPKWAATAGTCTAQSPVRSISASQRTALPPFVHGAFRTDDDDWVAVAKLSPGGLGGLFVDAGTPVIYLVGTSERDAVVAVIKSSPVAPFGVNLNATIARPGRWNFVQLAEWFGVLTPALESSGRQFVADIHESRNRIEYSVASAADRTALEAMLRQFGIPCFLVAINVVQ